MMEKNTINGRPVPGWLITGSYVLGWVMGVLLILQAVFGVAESRALLLTVGLYLILFPLFREGPETIIRRMFGGG